MDPESSRPSSVSELVTPGSASNLPFDRPHGRHRRRRRREATHLRYRPRLWAWAFIPWIVLFLLCFTGAKPGTIWAGYRHRLYRGLGSLAIKIAVSLKDGIVMAFLYDKVLLGYLLQFFYYLGMPWVSWIWDRLNPWVQENAASWLSSMWAHLLSWVQDFGKNTFEVRQANVDP